MAKLYDSFNFKDISTHAGNCAEILYRSFYFIRENKLWKGIFEYKWIGIGALLASALFSYWAMNDLWTYFFGSSDAASIDSTSLVANLDANEVKDTNKQGAISGGSKFLLMIVLEIVIFFFSIKTIHVLSGEKVDTGFNRFWKAEIRMIKVMFRSFIHGLIIQILCSVVLSMVGLDRLTPVVMFLVYGYFMGLGFLDNYNEQHGISIKESELIIRQHVGAALVLGITVSTLIVIPILGPLFAPILAAVAATIYGHQFHIQNEETAFVDKVKTKKARSQ